MAAGGPRNTITGAVRRRMTASPPAGNFDRDRQPSRTPTPRRPATEAVPHATTRMAAKITITHVRPRASAWAASPRRCRARRPSPSPPAPPAAASGRCRASGGSRRRWRSSRASGRTFTTPAATTATAWRNWRRRRCCTSPASTPSATPTSPTCWSSAAARSATTSRPASTPSTPFAPLPHQAAGGAAQQFPPPRRRRRPRVHGAHRGRLRLRPRRPQHRGAGGTAHPLAGEHRPGRRRPFHLAHTEFFQQLLATRSEKHVLVVERREGSAAGTTTATTTSSVQLEVTGIHPLLPPSASFSDTPTPPRATRRRAHGDGKPARPGLAGRLGDGPLAPPHRWPREAARRHSPARGRAGRARRCRR